MTGKPGKRSAGLLLYRRTGGSVELLLAHMGGPLWARREAGAWTVPKGEYVPPEEPLAAARREFEEELGLPPPEGPYIPLGEVRQSGGKTVTVWAVESDLAPEEIVPGTFEMEWPRGSGVLRAFPEIDRVAWCAPDLAGERLITAQRAFVDRLLSHTRPG
ncbi:NUDIX domain-containing protein [Streptomyces purpurogeneiscleroticus]|uniref:NUDIX domain-containing protein n=1 Tax=Streptomyces purpurogeneiscleroticus TaxID=68259 RepID=UPI001CBE9307|nr:NUDIX domain-containing protein [Streptomyces purpurogeneiscleroticus]MBZ4015258.1 DNA mismatch repair protein MutT [Streptomyces purpurogeneiscleroticus]